MCRHHVLAQQAGKAVSDIPTKILASPRLCNELQMQLTAVTDKLAEDLVKAHKELRTKEKKSEKDKQIHGRYV